MKRKFKEIIYSQLREAQEKYGGYTGNDIAIISRKINRQPKTVRRQIEKLREEDASFSNFTYIGKRYTDLTLDEVSFLQLKTKGINVTEKYFIETARASIQTPFSFRDLKNISIADLEGIN